MYQPVFVQGPDDMEIILRSVEVYYFENQPFPLSCNIRFHEIDRRFLDLFSWKLVENNACVSGQVLVLNTKQQARLKYSVHLKLTLDEEKAIGYIS